jgi:hypothetical protein
VFSGDDLPELRAYCIAALSGLDVNDFTDHCRPGSENDDPFSKIE